jgi:excisionase family DNA binding protein
MTAKTRKLGLTTSEAARHLGVSLSTIRRWSDMGHLRGYRTPGGQRRFSVEQPDAFLESLESSGPRRTPSPPEGEAEPRFAPEPDEPRGEPETEGEEPRFTVGDPAPVDDDPEPPAAA